MIAFGVLVADEAKFVRCAAEGLGLATETDSRVITREGAPSMAVGYNEILRQIRDDPNLEALVLLHEDAEILDGDFCAKIRSALQDPEVGLIGVVGARAVNGLAYWNGELGGRVTETRGTIVGSPVVGEVDAIDGLLMVLSPWVVQHLTFDDRCFQDFHGYDVDFSFTVRHAGRLVITEDIHVKHHTKGGYGDVVAYLRASRAWRQKWLRKAPAKTRLGALLSDARLVAAIVTRRVGGRRQGSTRRGG